MQEHHKLDYIEYASADLMQTKAFFERAFKWQFEDFGPDYTAFSDAGLNGGFFRGEQVSCVANGAALLIFFSDNLEMSCERVIAAGGTITEPIFVFPGGRRFHFTEPMGNEFAVWAFVTLVGFTFNLRFDYVHSCITPITCRCTCNASC